MPQPESINPYASPSALPDARVAGDPRLGLARRVRWQVRAVSLLWIVCGGVVLCEPLNMYSGTGLLDENASMLALLLCILGGCVWFRWRWAIWLGTFTGLVGTVHCTLQLREVMEAYEMQLIGEVAHVAIKTLLLNAGLFFASSLSGAYVLWRIRRLGKSGIAYRFDPSLPVGTFNYHGQPVDAVQVVKHARRWDRLVWLWMGLAVVIALIVFPCLLVLKEETYRITPDQWRIAIGLQIAALVAAFGLVYLGIAIRRVSLTAARTGLVIAYAVLAFSGLNLASPRMFFPGFAREFADMACSLFCGLAAAGFLTAIQTHLALWSAGKMKRIGLPASIRFEHLTREEPLNSSRGDRL